MHNWPGMEAGTFGVCAGPMMAAANGFKITVRGKGGHASAPQDCADPVPALFAIGQAFQTILTAASARWTRPCCPSRRCRPAAA